MMTDRDTTKEIPVQVRQASSARAAAHDDWWAAGAASARPTVGTIPVVRSDTSFARSAVLPGLMLVCAAVVMVASTMPWVTANFFNVSFHVSGTAQALATAFVINGWVTFACGGALAVLSALMIVTDEASLRVLTGLVAATTVGLALYDLIRVLQQIHYARQSAAHLYPSLARALTGHVHVGYGLIVVVAAAGVGFFAALMEGSSD